MSNRIRVIALLSLCVIFLIMSPTIISAKTNQEVLKWKVAVGDTMTYTVNKYYQYNEFDVDASNNSWNLSCYDLGGDEMIKVNLTAGSTIKAIITGLETNKANVSVIWNNKGYHNYTYEYYLANFPMETSFFPYYITKTTDNQTYLETLAQRETVNITNEEKIPPEETPSITSIHTVSLEGNLYKTNYRQRNSALLPNLVLDEQYTWNWKTGWLIHYSYKIYNTTGPDEWTIDFLRKEWTFTANGTSGSTPSFDGVPLILGVLMVAILLPRQKRKT